MDMTVPESPLFQFEDFPNLSHEKEVLLLKNLTDKFSDNITFGHSYEFGMDKFIRYVVNDFMELYIVTEEDVSSFVLCGVTWGLFTVQPLLYVHSRHYFI